MKFYLLCTLVFLTGSIQLQSQTEYDDLYPDNDSITSVYQPTAKNYIYLKSKKGSGGLERTPEADAILKMPVSEIVLVFTETSAGSIDQREDANRERWENLIKTYPEFFEHNATYVNLCQCNYNGDVEGFKKVQGFYIYYTPEKPAAAVNKPTPAAKSKNEESVAEKPNVGSKPEREKKVKETPVKEEPVAKEKTAKNNRNKEDDISMDIPKAPPVKRKGYSKPKTAKDPKACRLPCYENGDDDLNAFFKDYITLSKKQKRQGKQLVSVVRLQLNFDGSIKKAFVTGENAALNEQVTTAVNMMNLWNPAVKNGTTIKSEVKITLKYDKESKAMKPAEVAITPRLGPKCVCVSDREIFGSE
jgi:hypothetical protein